MEKKLPEKQPLYLGSKLHQEYLRGLIDGIASWPPPFINEQDLSIIVAKIKNRWEIPV